jgi:hypothetical protein
MPPPLQPATYFYRWRDLHLLAAMLWLCSAVSIERRKLIQYDMWDPFVILYWDGFG